MTASPSPPRITVVTPSYNHAPFLEACMRSVLGQQYPNLEYIVIDGGSTDGSVDIIKSLEREIAYWVSERDAGQYDAVNKGFRHATGEILAWLNSDDLYTPWAFAVVAEIFQHLPDVQWVSTLYPLFWNQAGAATHCTRLPGFSRKAVLGRGQGVQQESTFWRRSLWERAGAALDTKFTLAADLDLWARFWEHAELYGVAVPLGGIRRHEGQRHVRYFDQYMEEADLIARRYGMRARRGEQPSRIEKLRRLITLAAPKRARRVLRPLGLTLDLYEAHIIDQRARDATWTVRPVRF